MVYNLKIITIINQQQSNPKFKLIKYWMNQRVIVHNNNNINNKKADVNYILF